MTLPPSTGTAVETRNLSKSFGTHVAVRGLSLTVPRGEIFGFLGPNGAGKSTSIKMLLGLVRPSGGEALVLGAPTNDVTNRKQVGFLPEDFRFYDWLTASELLRFHGGLCGMSGAALSSRVPEVLELVGLGPHRDRRLRGFSKGMLQRIGLAQALVHEPQVIFLDEPTSGLDPIGRRMVRDILRAQRARGATVFLNSHLLSEIEITCDQVAFIKNGEVVAQRDLRAAPQDDVRLVIRARHLVPEVTGGLARWGRDVQVDGDRVTLVAHSQGAVPDVVRHLVASGAEVFEVRPEQVSLEEMFVKIMGEDSGL